MPTIKAFHNSGRWDADDALLARNVRRMRQDGRTFGTRTELTTAAQSDELSWPDDGWGHYHPRTEEGGWHDCAVEWDQDVWEKADAYVVQLTDIQIHTSDGFALPLSSMVCVRLWHQNAKRHVLVCVAHMQLANTDLRRRAWFEEAASMNRHFRQIRAEHPGWEIVFQGDCNRNQRDPDNRTLIRQNVTDGVKAMHNLWEEGMPVEGGTHGDRSILDLTLTTMAGGSRLLADDASSDHRPYESWMSLS